MVKIGIEGVPRTFPDGKVSFTTAGDSQDFGAPYIETDSVGKGYPILSIFNGLPAGQPPVPPGSAPGAVVNTTLQMYEEKLPRRNTPNNPAEQGGKVIMDLVNGVYTPRVQFTPPAIMP